MFRVVSKNETSYRQNIYVVSICRVSKMAKAKPIRNVWKIVAIVFILLFVAALAAGYFRAHRFKSSFKATTPDIADFAKAVVATELKANGEDIANYEVHIGNKVRKVNREGVSTNIMHVSLQNDSTRQAYLVDLTNGEVVMHSKTEYYGWMSESKRLPFRERPWFGKRGWR